MNNETKITVTTNDLLTVGDAAKILQVSRMTVYRWIEAGKMLSVELGGIVFVAVKEVEKMAADKKKNEG